MDDRVESVLIVEDSRTFSGMLSRAIEREFGIAPVVAATMQELRDVLQSETYRFFGAVVDLNLPDAPRAQCLMPILERKIPTVTLTGSYDKELRRKVLGLEILDYLVKGGRVLDRVISILRRININREVKVLIVDDAPVSRRMLKKLLSVHHFQVLEACDGQEALETLEENPDVKLIITDYHMPRLDGFDLISRVRQNYPMEELAIIGLSGMNQGELTARFLKLGANDFLYKGFSIEEFHCRVRQNIELVERFEEIREASNRDHLTGLYNRRFFFKSATNLFEACKRSGAPIALAMIDIDHFKLVNDSFGHEAGDMVLRELAMFLEKNCRKSDVVARYGGEEFCMLATNMSRSAVPMFFKRLCRGAASLGLAYEEKPIPFTISIGVTTFQDGSFEEALKEADRLLYQAKQAGRNRVVV